MVSPHVGAHADPMGDERKENEMTMGTQQARRLLRRTDNKMVAGVAAGLGDYFNVDPVWFRLGFVLTAFMGGFGVLAYIVLWVVMPEAGSVPSNAAERGLERVASSIRDTPAWIGVAFVILGGILLLNVAVDWRPGVVWGIALIGLGVLFFMQKDNPRPAVDAVLEPPSGMAPPMPPTVPAGAVPPPPPRVRERSTLGYMTFGVLLFAIGVVTLLDVQNAINLDPVQYLALAVGVIGVGLLVGSVFGRARWLIVPGVMLLPFLFAASLVHVPWTGGFGQRDFRPVGAGSTSNEYHLIAGRMTIDLRGLDSAGFHSIEATSVAGRIQILVPIGETVEIQAHAGAGQISLFGQTDEGVNVTMNRTFGDGVTVADGTPADISIDVEVGMGQVEVLRAEA